MNRMLSAAITTTAVVIWAGYVLITVLWYPYNPDTDWPYRNDVYGTEP